MTEANEGDSRPPPPPGFPEALTHLRWVRGTFLDQMVMLEEVLDAYLVDYLAIPDGLRLLAYASLTSKLMLARKGEMMCEMIDHSGLGEEFDDLKRELRAVIAFRNKLAHSRMAPSWADDGSVGVDAAVIIGWQKGELRETPLPPTQVNEWLERVPSLQSRLWEFMSRVATIRSGGALNESGA
jgi:hypothetical protein